jgi:hypothetical protein
VELIGVLSNHDLQGSLGRLAGKLAAVRASGVQPRAVPSQRLRCRRPGWVIDALVQVMGGRGEPMRAREVHAAVEAMLGEAVAWSSVKGALASNVSGPRLDSCGWRGGGTCWRAAESVEGRWRPKLSGASWPTPAKPMRARDIDAEVEEYPGRSVAAVAESS